MNTEKPVVYFTGDAYFIQYDETYLALVHTINHPVLGECDVRTSKIVNKISDDEFETLNTIYKRAVEDTN